MWTMSDNLKCAIPDNLHNNVQRALCNVSQYSKQCTIWTMSDIFVKCAMADKVWQCVMPDNIHNNVHSALCTVHCALCTVQCLTVFKTMYNVNNVWQCEVCNGWQWASISRHSGRSPVKDNVHTSQRQWQPHYVYTSSFYHMQSQIQMQIQLKMQIQLQIQFSQRQFTDQSNIMAAPYYVHSKHLPHVISKPARLLFFISKLGFWKSYSWL